jgi:hypothetical protein
VSRASQKPRSVFEKNKAQSIAGSNLSRDAASSVNSKFSLVELSNKGKSHQENKEPGLILIDKFL